MTSRLYVQKRGPSGGTNIELTAFTGRKGTPFFDDNTSLVQLGHRCEEGQASQGTFLLTDPLAELPKGDFTYNLPAHALVTWTEDAPGSELWLSRGRIASSDGGRGEVVVDDEVEFETVVDDGNVDLRGQAFTTSWVRPAETDYERLVALQAYTLDGASSTATWHRDTCDITVSSSHLAPNTSTVNMPAKKYLPGTQPADVIRDCAEMAGKFYGVVIHHTGGSHLCLLYILPTNHTTYSTAARISDDVADWDPEDLTAPVWEPHWEMGKASLYDGQTLLSGLVTTYGPETAVFNRFATNEESYDYWVEAYSDGTSTTASQASTRGSALLDVRRLTHVTHRVSVIVLPAQVDLLAAGMSLEIKATAALGGQYLDTWQTRRIAELQFEPRTDGRYWAHMHLDRPTMSRRPSGGSVGPIPPPTSEPPVAPTVDYHWGFEGTLLDDTSTYTWGNHAHATYTHTHVINPGMGNRSGTHPPLTPGTYTVTCTLNRGIDGYNPGGIRINVYAHGSGIGEVFVGQSVLVTAQAPQTVSFDVTMPSGTENWSSEIPYNFSECHDLTLSHGGSSEGFEGPDPPPASTSSEGTVGTSPYYSPLDHQHSWQTAESTPIADDGGYFQGANVEEALQELGSGSLGVSIRELITAHPFPICAHRGDIGNDGDGGTSQPENTLEAIRQAVKKGADLVEFDLWLSSDDTWWLMHDSTVDRTTDGSGTVNSKTDAQMAALQINGGYGYNASRHGTSLDVPTLDAILDVLRPYDVGIYFHLKETGDAEGTTLAQKIVDEGLVPRAIILCDGGDSQATAVKAVNSNIETAVLSGILTDVENYDDLDRLLAQQDHPTSATVVNGHFPKPTDMYFEVSTHYGTDETSLIEDAYEFGVRILMTNDLDNARQVRAEIVELATAGTATTRWEPVIFDNAGTPEITYFQDASSVWDIVMHEVDI